MDNKKPKYKCPECHLHYTDKEIAGKCEKWCRENKSCNIEITKFSFEAKQAVENANKKENE